MAAKNSPANFILFVGILAAGYFVFRTVTMNRQVLPTNRSGQKPGQIPATPATSPPVKKTDQGSQSNQNTPFSAVAIPGSPFGASGSKVDPPLGKEADNANSRGGKSTGKSNPNSTAPNTAGDSGGSAVTSTPFGAKQSLNGGDGAFETGNANAKRNNGLNFDKGSLGVDRGRAGLDSQPNVFASPGGSSGTITFGVLKQGGGNPTWAPPPPPQSTIDPTGRFSKAASLDFKVPPGNYSYTFETVPFDGDSTIHILRGLGANGISKFDMYAMAGAVDIADVKEFAKNETQVPPGEWETVTDLDPATGVQSPSAFSALDQNGRDYYALYAQHAGGTMTYLVVFVSPLNSVNIDTVEEIYLSLKGI
jgi:hypothetical protein